MSDDEGKRQEITVTMHARHWRSVLRALESNRVHIDEHIKRQVAANELRVTEGVMWKVDLKNREVPIIEACRAAMASNPDLARWFDGTAAEGAVPGEGRDDARQ